MTLPPKGFKTITVNLKTYRALQLMMRTKGYTSPAKAIKELLKYAQYL